MFGFTLKSGKRMVQSHEEERIGMGIRINIVASWHWGEATRCWKNKSNTPTALVPHPRREARRVPHIQQIRHRPRPRSPPIGLLQSPRQRPHPRSPSRCPRQMVQQRGWAEDCCSRRCRWVGCINEACWKGIKPKGMLVDDGRRF